MFEYSPKGRLRMWILWLLSESPKRGIEIIDDIYKMTWGSWRPSPGSIYPILASLEKENLIEKTTDGKYKITSKGLDLVREHFPITPAYNRTIATALEELDSVVQFFEEVGKENLTPYKDKILSYAERLRKLVE